MINLLIDGESVKGNISPLTLFLYKQEFNESLLDDGLTLIYEENIALLSKVMWSMIKTVNYDLETYIQWIELIQEKDVTSNQHLIEYEIGTRLLIKNSEVSNVSESKENDKEKDIDIGILKIITDLRIDLNIVNLMSLDSFVKFQDLHISKENERTFATPKQVDKFFL